MLPTAQQMPFQHHCRGYDPSAVAELDDPLFVLLKKGAAVFKWPPLGSLTRLVGRCRNEGRDIAPLHERRASIGMLLHHLGNAVRHVDSNTGHETVVVFGTLSWTSHLAPAER